jgi:hypothetical protein
MIENLPQPVTAENTIPQLTLMPPGRPPELLEAAKPNPFRRLLSATKHAGQLALHNPLKSSQVALTLLELTPANEAVRLAIWGLGEGIAPHDPIVGAMTYGLSTLAVESAGAIAAAPLLGTEKSKQFAGYLNTKIAKVRKNPETVELSKVTKASVALFGGSVAAMAIEQLEDPERSVNKHRRHGLWTSTWVAGAAAVQGALMAEGINLGLDHPKTAGEVVGVLGLAAGARFAERRHARHERAKTTSYYETAMSEKSKGPQREGLGITDLSKALKDPDTHYTTVKSGTQKIKWPLLTPITNFSEYLPKYFDDKYGSTDDVYYLSLPEDLSDFDTDDVLGVIQEASEQDKVIVYDELVGTEGTMGRLQTLLAGYDPSLSLERDAFVDPKNSTEAAVIHYEGLGRRVGENTISSSSNLREIYDLLCSEHDEAEYFRGSVLLNPDKNEEELPTGVKVIDRLWDIYDGQFSKLVENHPSRQAQTAEELKAMVNDPGTLTVAHMLKDGDIASFAMFVTDIDACDWLRTDYYKEKFPDDVILYFPGIASDSSKKGERFSLKIVDLVAKVLASTDRDARIVFQCTNISADYIPAIVQGATAATGIGEIELNEMCRYEYAALKIVEKNDE